MLHSSLLYHSLWSCSASCILSVYILSNKRKDWLWHCLLFRISPSEGAKRRHFKNPGPEFLCQSVKSSSSMKALLALRSRFTWLLALWRVLITLASLIAIIFHYVCHGKKLFQILRLPLLCEMYNAWLSAAVDNLICKRVNTLYEVI